MPIYEYECMACNHCFEQIVFAGDDNQPVCPKCCGKNVKRLMSASSCIGLSEKSCAPVGAGTGFS